MAIDPRIRARRIAVRRGIGRRRLHRWVAVVVVVTTVAVVVAAGVALARSPLLDVDRVVVTGADRTGAEAVVAAAGVEPGDPLLSADTSAVADAVAALPWVASTTVERSLPGTLRITVEERLPVAAVAGPGPVFSLVDERGRVLAEVPPEAAEVVVVAGLEPPGPPGSTIPPSAEGALAVAAALPEALHGRVTRIVAADEGEVRLELRRNVASTDDASTDDAGTDDAVTVLLGDDGELAAKLSALVTVAASVDLDDVAVVDLGVPSAPALTPR